MEHHILRPRIPKGKSIDEAVEEIMKKSKAETTSPRNPATEDIPAPDFTGNSTYEFLKDKAIHERIIQKYQGIDVITKVIYDNNEGIVKGSTPFYVAAVNDELRSTGLQTATQADLEQILKTNALELKGHYEDTGLVWHSNKYFNEYLAGILFNEARAKGILLEEGKPYVFPLCALTLVKDDNSPHKLSFILLKPELCFPAPILASVSRQKFDDSDIDEKTGLPKIVKANGSRILYTRNWENYGDRKMHGVSRFDLHFDLGLSAGWYDLDGSNADGRVVLRAEGTRAGSLGGSS